MIEEPLFAVVILGLTFAFFIAGFCISRAKAWLIPAIPTLLFAVGLLVADWLVLSPKERVQLAVADCVVAFQENQVDRLTTHIAPNLVSILKWDLTGIFEVLEFTKAFANDLKLTYDAQGTPPTVKARFIAGAHFHARKGNVNLPLERYVTRLEVTFQEFEPGQWLIVSVEEKPIVNNQSGIRN